MEMFQMARGEWLPGGATGVIIFIAAILTIVIVTMRERWKNKK